MASQGPESHICKVCQSFLGRPDKSYASSIRWPANKHRYLHEDDIADGAARKCPICVLILHYLQRSPYKRPKSFPAPYQLALHKMVSRSNHNDFIQGAASGPIQNLELHLEIRDRWYPPRFWIEIERQDDTQGVTAIRRTADHKKDFTSEEAASSVQINTSRLPISSGADSRLFSIKSWIVDCHNNHPRCRQEVDRVKKPYLPSRLIGVGAVSGIRLVLRSEVSQDNVAYATVSHRWRLTGMPKLVRATYESMRLDIIQESLPPVFRDSIVLCRYLQIRYLWIDALCLLQDSDIDCGAEIEQMGDIYTHSFCNFSATTAAETSVGLFVDDPLHLATAFPLTIERKGQTYECYGFSSQATSSLSNEALSKRGWVLQERLLSPRTIHFGSQITWECLDMLANELFPKRIPLGIPEWGYGTPFKMSRLLGYVTSNDTSITPSTQDTITASTKLYAAWRDVTQTYSTCDLTFESDLFPAISGLARRFNECLNNTYLAGLWQGDLI